MQDRWLRKGPALEEVVSERIDRRKDRKEIAIVITTYQNPSLLKKHLDALQRQTLLDFDLIIVYGEKDAIADIPLPALHIKEKGRGGSSGAYYIGEKTALSEGYKIIMLADDDCIPASDDLVRSLTTLVRSGKMIVMPMLDKKGDLRRTRIPHYYGTFSREVFEKSGLTYFPLFFGGDDVELMHRMEKAGYEAVHSKSGVTHPEIVPFFMDASPKRYYYTRGEFEVLVLRGSIAGPFVFALFHFIASAALIAIGRSDIGLRILQGLADGAGMGFFENKSLSQKGMRESEAEGGWDAVFEPDGKDRFISPNMMLHKGGAAWMRLFDLAVQILRTLALMPQHFGKKILIRKMNPPLSLILMLGARSAFFEFDGKVFRICESRNIISIALGIIFVALAILPSLALSTLLSLAGHLNRLRKGAGSRAYGL